MPPIPLRAYSAAAVTPSGALLVHGGHDTTVALGDLWEILVSGSWGTTPPTEFALAGSKPSARSRHTLTPIDTARDAANTELLLFGGTDGTTLVSGGEMLWSLLYTFSTSAPTPSAVAWEQESVGSEPWDSQISPRARHAASYDAETCRLHIYGGATSPDARNADIASDQWYLQLPCAP